MSSSYTLLSLVDYSTDLLSPPLRHQYFNKANRRLDHLRSTKYKLNGPHDALSGLLSEAKLNY